MAQAKNYNCYAEVVGNVGAITMNPSEKNFGKMRFVLINHPTYAKKDGTKVREDNPINVIVYNAKLQTKVTKGAFLRVKGYLEDNSYKDADGNWHNHRNEVVAKAIEVLKAREDGTVENTETGQVEDIENAVEVSEQ